MPFSISDKYIANKIPIKNIDVIQLGRKNPILHQYMLDYCEKYKNIEYVYQICNKGHLEYVSTLRGNIGRYDTRQQYIELLSSCKISLVSTPSVDDSKKFHGIDFVTPRFFESAAFYCYMIGRYTENKETDLLGLSSICTNISSYESFENEISRLLSYKEFKYKDQYDVFLKNNCTSKRCKEIIKCCSCLL
jgi:hypothetical protein